MVELAETGSGTRRPVPGYGRAVVYVYYEIETYRYIKRTKVSDHITVL